MKRRHLHLTFLFMILISAYSFAQITIGTGTNESQAVPIEPYYGYTYSQSIYEQAEINATGNITSVAWYFSGTSTLSNTQDITIWMGTTTKADFASSTDWVDVATLTQVFSGNLGTPSGTGWITVTLDVPFAYANVGNLIIAVDENTGSYNSSSDDFYCTSVGTQRSIYYRSDGTNPDPIAPPSATSTISYVPNVQLGGLVAANPPNCDAVMTNPTDAETDVIAETSIFWSGASGSPTGYNIQIGTTNGGSEFLASTDLGNVTSYTPASNFAYSTTYYVTITPYNDNGNATGCTEYSFTTQADPTLIAPHTESFDPSSTLAGWLVSSTSGGPWGIGTGSSINTLNCGTPDEHTGNGGNFAWMDQSGTDVGVILEMPNVNISALTTPYLKLYSWMCGVGYSPANFTYVEAYDGSAWNIVGTIQSATGTWEEYGYDLTSFVYNTNLVKIRFRAESGGSADDYYGDNVLDDISIDEAPSCFNPSGMSAANVIATSADLSWTAGNSETSWNLEWNAGADFTPGTGANSGGTTASTSSAFTISPLSDQTTYYVYYQADCGGSTSDWVGPVMFTTPCLNTTVSAAAEYCEDFAADPACWAQSGTSNWSVGATGYATANFYSVNNATYIYTTQGFAIDAGMTPRLSYDWSHAYSSSYPDDRLDIDVSTDGGATWTNISSQIGSTFDSDDGAGNTSPGAFVNAKVDMSAYAGNTILLRFFATSDYGPHLFIDNICIEETPSCVEPSTLTASNPTTTGADLGWTAGGTETAWDLEIGAAGFTPSGTPTDAAVGTNPYTWSSGSSNVSYDYYVRSSCGGDQSPWVGPYTFTTLCGGAGTVEITMEINVGAYPGEISWEIQDNDNGDAVVYSNSYSGATANSVVTETYCLNAGTNYTMVTNDSYGDGWNNGTYTITYGPCPTALANNGGLSPAGSGSTEAFVGPTIPASPVCGCTDSTADNYNASANMDDGSCTYPIPLGTDCTDYYPLSDCESLTGLSTLATGDSYNGITTCLSGYDANNDFVFQYTAPAYDVLARISCPTAYPGLSIQVMSDCPDVATSCIASTSIGWTGTPNLYNVKLTANTTYYILVDSDRQTAGSFDFSFAAIPADILPRGFNTTGLTADAECTDADGWTHYYSAANGYLLLSLQKNGSDIGTVGDGTFSCMSQDNGQAQYYNSGVGFINNSWGGVFFERKWDVLPTTQPDVVTNGNVGVRFYFHEQNYQDVMDGVDGQVGSDGVMGSNAGLTKESLTFHKVIGTDDPIDIPSLEAAEIVFIENGTVGLNGWALGGDGTDTPYYAEYMVNSFSGGGGGGAAGNAQAILPIELVSFTGQAMDKYNELTWISAMEENTKMHYIERSSDGIKDFVAIGNIAAAGFSQEEIRYTLEDNNPLTFGYYRLKTVDLDGAVQYSNVIAIQRRGDIFDVINAYPVPTTKDLTVEFVTSEEEEVTYTLTDITGKVMMQNVIDATKGINKQVIDLATFSNGVYFLTLQNSKTRIIKNIVKN